MQNNTLQNLNTNQIYAPYIGMGNGILQPRHNSMLPRDAYIGTQPSAMQSFASPLSGSLAQNPAMASYMGYTQAGINPTATENARLLLLNFNPNSFLRFLEQGSAEQGATIIRQMMNVYMQLYNDTGMYNVGTAIPNANGSRMTSLDFGVPLGNPTAGLMSVSAKSNVISQQFLSFVTNLKQFIDTAGRANPALGKKLSDMNALMSDEIGVFQEQLKRAEDNRKSEIGLAESQLSDLTKEALKDTKK